MTDASKLTKDSRPLRMGAIELTLQRRILDQRPDPGVTAEELAARGPRNAGWSIRVLDPETRVEHLRFDGFVKDPHYHYTSGPQPDPLAYDSVANGDFLEWVCERLSTRLDAMLRTAGADDLAQRVDQRAIKVLVSNSMDELRAWADEVTESVTHVVK